MCPKSNIPLPLPPPPPPLPPGGLKNWKPNPSSAPTPPPPLPTLPSTAHADVSGDRGALLAEIRRGFKLRSTSRNDKSDDEESKEQSTPPKPIVHKQKDAQSVADKSNEQPATREIEIKTTGTVTIGDIGTQNVEKTVTTRGKVLKCLAALSLPFIFFVTGFYFPSFILVVSCTVPIAGVALPFAAVVVCGIAGFISTAYLIGSIVSPASSKKEVGHSEEKFAKPTQQLEESTALQEPTQEFGYNSDNVGHDEVDGKVPTVTLGTAIPQLALPPASTPPSGGLPLPPPPGVIAPPPPPQLPQIVPGDIAGEAMKKVQKMQDTSEEKKKKSTPQHEMQQGPGVPPTPPPPPLQVAKGAGAPPPPPPPGAILLLPTNINGHKNKVLQY